ncbi:hypothetical protein ABT090_20920 [Streptomyces asoensis]|uniref:hypothetical protein n=1 Tax=Streptomyces asoensis TaxID=249586 RepID=UPI0033342562
MSTADHVLDQIDNALHDWAVSDDAMRSRPEPEPRTDAGPRMWISTVGADPEAGGWQELGQVNSIEFQVEPEFQQQWQELRDYLVRVEAERVRRAQEALAAFARAYTQTIKPAMEAAAKGLAEIQKAAQHVDPPLPPGRRRDRPAWQSPYGPPQRRR